MTTSESSFLATEEPESISFQDSLRFFRQQLGNDDASSDEYRSEDGHCSISIPTVDSILESVRVLRAIQKSQIREKSTVHQNSIHLDAEKYSKTPPQLLFKADSILNSLQTTDSNIYENNFGNGIFVEDILNNGHGSSNFWPKNAVEVQEISCSSKNNNNLKCYNNTAFRKTGALSNQVGHLDETTENNSVSKSVSDVVFGDAESILNKLKCSSSGDFVENTLNVPTTDVRCSVDEASEVDCFETECVAEQYGANEGLFIEDSRYHSGYSSAVLSEFQSPTEDQGDSGVVLTAEDFSIHSPHYSSNTEVYRSYSQLEDSRCRLPTIHEQPVERIFEEVTIKDRKPVYSKQQINDDEEVEECEVGSTDVSETDSEAPSQILSSSLEDNSVTEIVNNLKNRNCTENGQSDSGKVNLKDNSPLLRTKKLTTSSWDLVSIVKLLFAIEDLQYPKMLCEEKRKVFVLSKGVFSHLLEGVYTLLFKERTLFILDETGVCLVLPLANAEISLGEDCSLVLDNKMGECLYLKCESAEEVQILSNLFKSSSECIDLMQSSLKTHQNVVIIDLGSCSTRAGILMDQPTLPTLFFPSVCAVNKITGKHVYGVEALEPSERQNATISFPLRPSAKITKHSVDVDQVTGIFKKIFKDLRIDPKRYAVLVCLPRNLSTIVQNAIVKVLLENLNVKAVSLSHQAILTMYAHNVSTGIVLDIGDRMDILPVIDGFIVEGGVTRLPYGGQRLIHHMKHALAEKHISLSNDIDSFVVQYISERSLYVAEDFERDSSLPQHTLRKVVDLKPFARDDNCLKSAVLDDARFKVPEGLFKPILWGLDSPGVHHLVQKAIQAAGVDARKKVAENIYLSGGVTLIPGFVERLVKEVTKLNEPRITPKVHASNYRYHCTFIGACKFASMDVFPQVCLTKKEYSKNGQESLKKFLLCV